MASPESSPPTTERIFELVGIVAQFDPRAIEGNLYLDPSDLSLIEDSINDTLRVSQASGAQGAGHILAAPGLQLDVLIIGNRLEVRSNQRAFSEETASRAAQFLHNVMSHLPVLAWQSIGYNFVLRIVSPRPAIEKLRGSLLSSELKVSSGKIIGAGAWLWVEVDDDAVLWLRLEPQRNDPATERIVVNANFNVALQGDRQLPDAERMTEQLITYERWLDTNLTGLKL